MNPENGKKTYESIDIPKNLNETVMQTMASKIRKHPKQRNPIALSGEAVLRRQQPFWSQAPSG